MIPLIQSTFYHEAETKQALAAFILGAHHLSFGPECERFEQQFSDYQQRKECVMVNSGSSANMAIIQALLNLGWIKAHDNVGFSAVTWSTNAMPLIQLGLSPIPVDVAVETLNVTRETLEQTYSRTPIKMLFLTHLLGLCSDLDDIVAFCEAHDILLIEDTCESLGSVYQGKKLGNFGLAATFSFYVGHHLSTVEGGAIATDNQALADMLRIVRAHGWDRNLNQDGRERVQQSHQINSIFYSRYTFYDLGFNFRPTEINGYLGQIQLSYLDEMVAKREHNFDRFMRVAGAHQDWYYPLSFSHMDLVSSFSLPVVCKEATLRKDLVHACRDKIEVRPIVGGNIVEQPFFKKHVAQSQASTPNAALIHTHGLYMGNNPELTESQLNCMTDTISHLSSAT